MSDSNYSVKTLLPGGGSNVKYTPEELEAKQNAHRPQNPKPAAGTTADEVRLAIVANNVREGTLKELNNRIVLAVRADNDLLPKLEKIVDGVLAKSVKDAKGE